MVRPDAPYGSFQRQNGLSPIIFDNPEQHQHAHTSSNPTEQKVVLEEVHRDTAAEQVNPCDFVRESFGLTPRGVLLASPWAINATGKPIDDAFVLGSLLDTPLSQLLASDRVKEIRSRANENFGHCKIFAWQFSERTDSFERLFDAADPLYASASSAGLAAE